MTSTVYLEQTTRPVCIILKGWKLIIIRDLVCASIFAYACTVCFLIMRLRLAFCAVLSIPSVVYVGILNFIVPIIVPIYHLKAESQLNAS